VRRYRLGARMKKTFRVLLGLALGVALLALSFRGVEWGRVWQECRNASPLYILASIFVGIVFHNLLRAWRWRVMLSSEKKGIGLYNLYSTTMIGYAVSWALPLRLGEVVRPVLLAQREKIRVSPALTTIAIERLLDGLAVVALFAMALEAWPGREGIGTQGEEILGYARLGGVVMLVGSAVLFGALIAATATRRRWEPRAEALAARSGAGLRARALRFLVGIVEGGAILSRPLGLVAVAGQSLAIWVVIGASLWLGLLGGGVRISFLEIFIFLPASVAGIGVPTPGGAGSYELFVSRALHHLFGQPLDKAYAATLILHVVITLVPVVLLGLVLLWRDGISLSGLREALAAAGAEHGAAPRRAAAAGDQTAGGAESGAGGTR